MVSKNIATVFSSSLRMKIEDNHELWKIIGNINWLTFQNIFQNVIGLVVVAWVARYLGPNQFGLINYALSFVALFSALATLGLDNIVVRNIVSDPENKRRYLGSTLVLKFLGSLLMLIVSTVGIICIEPSNELIQLFVIIIALSYVFKSFDTIHLWFQSQVQAKYSVLSRTISFFNTW